MFTVIDDTNSINNSTANLYQGVLELGSGDDLLVQSNGSILATGSSSTAVYLDAYGTSDSIIVNGLIFGNTEGIYSLGQYAKITVNGEVLGKSVGVSIDNGASLFVGKNGEVSGDVEGVTMQGNSLLINDGTVNGSENDAVQFGSGRIENNGLISSQFDAIFYTAVGAGYIDNTGTIQGDLQTYYNASASTSQLSINNTGTWDGNLDLSPGADTVTNSGHIAGSITLGNGDNTFNGHGGRVDGAIYGGTGVDTIRAGDDGETMYGAGGHDRLVGGAGADTFLIASFNSADSDVIKHFDVAQDTIELYSAVFTHLKADTTPAFSIGTTASSATDFLFYNSSTGGLYYDVDGNKTAHAPALVAKLDTGLHLTASNFSVV